MKKMNSCSISNTIMTECIDTLISHASEQEGAETQIYKQLQLTLKELAVLKQADIAIYLAKTQNTIQS